MKIHATGISSSAVFRKFPKKRLRFLKPQRPRGYNGRMMKLMSIMTYQIRLIIDMKTGELISVPVHTRKKQRGGKKTS